MIIRLSVLAAALALLLAGCVDNSGYLPESAGGQGEVLVVMSKGHWEGEPGAAVRSILEQPIEGLPQREPRFKVAQVTLENFGSLLTVHHSLLVAVIDPNEDTLGMQVLRDRYAKGQLIIRMAAKDPVSWIALMQQEGYNAANVIEDHQRQRVGQRLMREKDAVVANKVRDVQHLELDIPGGYHVMKQNDSAAWLQRDRIVQSGGLEHNVIEGLLIHTHRYTSDSTFSVPFLVDQRDSTTKYLVEGPNAGSYMNVQRGFEDMDLMPTSRAVSLQGRYGYLMRGLFGMHGAKMGGPFVSLSTVDEERGRLVTVEGFVYAPQFDKREYVRELEALIFSLRITPLTSP